MESRALEWWRLIGQGLSGKRAAPPQAAVGELRSLNQLLTAAVRRRQGLLLHLDLRPLGRGRATGSLAHEFPACADEALELVLQALAEQAGETALRVWYTASASRRNKVVLSARRAGLGRRLRRSVAYRRAHKLLSRYHGGLQLLCGEDQDSLVLSCDFGPEGDALATTGTG